VSGRLPVRCVLREDQGVNDEDDSDQSRSGGEAGDVASLPSQQRSRGRVWLNLHNGPRGGDYPTGKGLSVSDPNRPGKVYGDYVYGRMLKVGFAWGAVSVTILDGTPRADYQSWCGKYPTYQNLVEAAIESLKK
jgi:hypothetical protein